MDHSSRYAEFWAQGFAIAKSVLTSAQVADIKTALNGLSLNGVGSRNLLPQIWCQSIVQILKQHPSVAPLMTSEWVAVQCTLFEKSADCNWLVPLHQDLSIPVLERLHHPLLSGWSQKEGVWYCHPPENMLEQLIVIRIHLDDCDAENGALYVVPSSHREGRLAEAAIPLLQAKHGKHLCAVKQGDALMMQPLLLHSSSKAAVPNRRRVLHFLFGPAALPLGLRWHYAV